MGKDYTASHAAALVRQLPRGSRVLKAINPDTEWGLTEQLLGLLEFNVRAFHYSFTEDAAKGANRPTPIVPGIGSGASAVGFEVEELNRILNLPREEV